MTSSPHPARGRRLSECDLWRAQRRYFETRGPAAWEPGQVPHYVTSNPFIAGAYARLALAFARDARARGWLGRDAPLTVLELGGGTGRFAYHFLHRARTLGGSEAGGLRYVLTDAYEPTIAAWERHPRLAPLLEAGRLDVAGFDAERDAAITLRRANRRLGPGDLGGPLLVIANYVFDSLPQDAFWIEDGRLHELLVAQRAAPLAEAPALEEHAELDFEAAPIEAAGYYGDPEWDALLHAQTLRFASRPAAASVLPIAALRCLRNLAAIPAGQRLLLLAADRGDHRPDSVDGGRALQVAVHGSASMRVDFHVIAAWFASRGGRALHPEAGPENLDVGAYLLGEGTGSLPETERTFREALAEFGPDDFFALRRLLDTCYDDMTVPQALAALRLSAWDARVFEGLARPLARLAPDLDPGQALDLERAAARVWEMFFSIREGGVDAAELALTLGEVLLAAHRVDAALRYFELAGPGVAHRAGVARQRLARDAGAGA